MMPHMDVLPDDEKCALDMSTYENLSNVCNAPPLHSATPIPKDDTDGSYVFVTSVDAATNLDHAAPDLNAQPMCSHIVDAQIQVHNPDELKDSQFSLSEHIKESDAVRDKIRLADVLHSSDAKVDEAEPGLHSSQTVEQTRVLENQTINESFDAETNSGQIHGLHSPQEVEDNQIREENQRISTSGSSNTDANLSGQIEVESSQMAEDIQIHEDDGIVEIMKSSGTETNLVVNIEAECSQKEDGIQIHKDNGTVAIKFSDTESNPGEEIEVESSPKAQDNQNHEENGIMKAFELSDAEANPRSEIEVESSREMEDIELQGQNEVVDTIKSSTTMENRGQEGEVIPGYNERVVSIELSNAIHDSSEEAEMESFERDEGIQEAEDADVEAADCCCVTGKEIVDGIVNKDVISDPIGGIEESQIITMGAAKSDLDHSDDSMENVKEECTSGVALNDKNSEITQFTICQDGDHYQVVGEELENLNNEVCLLEPSEENKAEVEQHLVATPSPLVSSEDINGSISISSEDGLPTSMDQDDPLGTIDGNDTVANRTSFHDHTETLSGSVVCDIATVETHELSPTVLITDPILELNEITVNEQEVNHVLELEENSEMVSNPKVDKCEVEVLEDMVSGNEDDMPTALDKSKIYCGDDFVADSQLVAEDIGTLESTDTAVSAVVIGNTSIEIREPASTNFPNDPLVRSDLDVEDCTISEIGTSAGDVVQPDKEVSESHEVGFLGNSNLETKCEDDHVEKDHLVPSHCNDCPSVECEERGSTVPEVPNGVDKSSAIQLISAVARDSELHDNKSSSSPTANEKPEDDIKIPSSIGDDRRNIPGNDCSVSNTEILKDSILNKEENLHLLSDVVSEIDGKPTTEEIEVNREGCQNEPSSISPEGSGDALTGQNVGAEAGTRPFNFLVKVPRFDDKNIREQIKCAQAEVDWKTKDRDAIRVQIQTMRVIMIINLLFRILLCVCMCAYYIYKSFMAQMVIRSGCMESVE